MLRWLFLLIVILTGTAVAAPVVVQMNAAAPAAASSTLTATVLATPSPGNTEVITYYIYNTVGNMYTPPTPSGWALALTCTDNQRSQIYAFTKKAGASEPTSVSATITGSDYYTSAWYDITGSNATFDKSSCVAFATATVTATAITPTNNGELAIVSFNNAKVGTPTDTNGWTASDKNGGVFSHFDYTVAGTSAIAPSVTYTSSPSPAYGVAAAMLLSTPAPTSSAAPGYTNLMTLFAGQNAAPIVGVATPTPAPTATPTAAPSVFAYAPSYTYLGTQSNGAGGYDNGGVALINGAMMSAVNVRYCESGNTSGAWSCDYSGFCNGKVNCYPVRYTTLNSFSCDASYEVSIWADINTLPGDVAVLHSSSPASPTTRMAGSGACPPTGEDLNPGYVSGANNLVTEWNTHYFNGVPTYWLVRWDNFSLISNSIEYGSTPWTSLVNYMNDATSFLAQFPTYMMGANAFGEEGHFCNNNCTGSSFQFACMDHVCDSVDSWCSNNTHSNFKFIQSERAIVNRSYGGSSFIQWNLPYLLNTFAQLTNNPGCAGMDVVALNPVNTAMNGDSHFFRNEQLWLRLFAEPGNYKGQKNDRTWVPQRYEDCTDSGQFTCIDQVTIFPEDGWQGIPLDSGMAKFSDGGANAGTGDGCGPSDSGGVTLYKVRCVGTNDQGGTGAIWARAFRYYKFGVYQGIAVLLFNETSQTQAIQDNDCKVDGLTTPCSAYPYYWRYQGTGPETCYEDQGTNLGTPSATCSPGDTLTPASVGGQSAWGTLPWNGTATLAGVSTANTLGVCPLPLDNFNGVQGTGANPLLDTEDCGVLLMSQP